MCGLLIDGKCAAIAGLWTTCQWPGATRWTTDRSIVPQGSQWAATSTNKANPRTSASPVYVQLFTSLFHCVDTALIVTASAPSASELATFLFLPPTLMEVCHNWEKGIFIIYSMFVREKKEKGSLMGNKWLKVYFEFAVHYLFEPLGSVSTWAVLLISWMNLCFSTRSARQTRTTCSTMWTSSLIIILDQRRTGDPPSLATVAALLLPRSFRAGWFLLGPVML